MDTFRIVVTGGGTGGHITPGIAVVEKIRSRVSNVRVLWVGAEGRKEEDLVPRHDIPLVTMNLQGLQRSFSASALWRNSMLALRWLTLAPVLKARAILREFAPNVILGTGGYVCAPVLLAGSMMGIKTWVLEQNSVPGLTVRFLSRFVTGVGIAYEITRSYLPDSCSVRLVGNPVSEDFLTVSAEEGRRLYGLNPDLKTLLVIGGSLGSTALNKVIYDLLLSGDSGSAYSGWQILHSVGLNKFESIPENLKHIPNYHPHAFLYRPEAALAAADLVLCRAGAMTLAEVTVRGKAAVIVPWPKAVRNHQYTNAATLAAEQAAILLPESELTSAKLAILLNDFILHPDLLETMAQKSRQLGNPDAAEKITDLLLAKSRD